MAITETPRTPGPGDGHGPDAPLPTGAQVTLRFGDQTATLTEVGGALRNYSQAGRPVLDGFEAHELITGGRGQTFIPWPNRLRGGRYVWKGQSHQLDLSEPDTSGAIHGLTRWASWRILEQTSALVRFGHVLHPCPGWPFTLQCELVYRLSREGLTVETRAKNLGSSPCPYGTGAHPYLTVGTATVDDALLRVPASRYLPVDDAGIPIDRRPVKGTSYDFRELRRIGATGLDITLTSLERDPDGRARVRLESGEGRRVTVWLGEGYDFVQLYSGDDLPEPHRRRRSLAIEPMSCAPDAFNSGDGLDELAPGESHEVMWGIDPRTD